MKKLFLLFVLLVGCSDVHGVKVPKDLDASAKDVSVVQAPSDVSVRALNYCTTWCHHLASNAGDDKQCVGECQAQYPECTVNDQ